jgi:hypothetical protein
MFKVTRYVVRQSGARGAEVSEFYSRGEAVSAARAARKRLGSVDVYEVTGWPVQDLWDRPRLVVRLAA